MRFCLDYRFEAQCNHRERGRAGVSFTEGSVMAEAEVSVRLLAEGHESRYVAASRSWKTRSSLPYFSMCGFFYI